MFFGTLGKTTTKWQASSLRDVANVARRRGGEGRGRVKYRGRNERHGRCENEGRGGKGAKADGERMEGDTERASLKRNSSWLLGIVGRGDVSWVFSLFCRNA